MKGCSNLTILTFEETAAELSRLGLSASDVARPLKLEILVERDKGNLTDEQFSELMSVAR